LREITQLYIYVGFCFYLALFQAAAALTLKGQRAAAVPHPCKVPPAISSWSELRATLPEHLQLKIAAAERRRQLRQQQQDRRRELAKLRQSLPPVDTSVEALATLERELALSGSSLNTLKQKSFTSFLEEALGSLNLLPEIHR
jgi:hypothetical protein